MLRTNIESSVNQIMSGQYPQYDDNCRDSIAESLAWLAQAHKDDPKLTDLSPLTVRADHLPGEVTLDDIRSWSSVVIVDFSSL